MTPLQSGEYEHYTGKRYRVLTCAKHSETLEDFVVYEAQYDNTLSKIWVRPLSLFQEEVTVNGKRVPRFRYIGK